MHQVSTRFNAQYKANQKLSHVQTYGFCSRDWKAWFFYPNTLNFVAAAEMGEGEEPVEGEEQMEGEDEELDEGEDANEKKYVKKEYVATIPYHSKYVEKTIEDVEALSVKNSR